MTTLFPARRASRTATGILAATALALAGTVIGAPVAAAAVTCTVAQLCEAESATLSGGARLDTEHAGYTGAGFVAGIGGGGGASMAFGADTATAGEHTVTIRYANGGDRARSMTLVVNGTSVPVRLLTTGSWTSWSTVTVRVDLRAGANALDLRVAAGNDGQVNVDSFRVDVAQPCAVAQLCQAELGVLSGGAQTANDHAGYTGTSFVEGMGPGAGIAFTASAPAAGRHEVTVRYANWQGGDGQTKTRTLTLTVNGTDVPVSLPTTGGWGTWGTLAVPVTLTAGTNALKLHVATGNDGNVNIDHVQVDAVDDGTPVERGVTMRLFDIGFGLQKLCELKPGQTPNIDVLRPTVNWSTATDWAGMTVNYVAQVVADLAVPAAGTYTFRLTSDDGSRLSIDDRPVVDHDGLHGATSKDGEVTLTAGSHDLEIDYFQAGGGAELKLEWRRPGQTGFEVVPTSAFSVEAGGARVVAPGTKECTGLSEGPGDGLPLAGVHPSFTLSNLRPDGFTPDVSGMAWYPNGDLAVLTWGAGQETTNGRLYRVSGVQTATSPATVEYTQIASGLQEPQGVQVVDDVVYVATKSGLEKMVDADGNGSLETKTRLTTWPNGNNFHEFAFGLPYEDGHFYVALSVALNRSGDSVVPQPAANRGTVLKIDKDTGAFEHVAGGLRTPNGMGWGADGALLITDNQGGWVPASKLVEVKQGAYFNHPTTFVEGGVTKSGPFDDQPVTQPLVWMPHNEIANAPSTPVLMQEGPFAGQLAIGDVTYGGVQRVFLETVEGQKQGALYRMSQGLEAGVNEMAVGPDGDLYIGGIGYDGNWNQPGKLRYGLQKLSANGTVTMDILRTEITDKGFRLTYTKPLSQETRAGIADRYRLQQWRYNPTAQYGGPKIDQEPLFVASATVSADGTTVDLTVPGVKPGRVVHIASPRPFSATDGQALWSTEVWYTANKVPGYVAPAETGWYEAEEASLTSGASVANEHSGYSGSGFAAGFHNAGATLTFTAHAPAAGNQPVHVRYANGPNPFQGTKTVALYVNGTKVDPLVLASTGDWKTWRTTTRQLDLRAGANTITLKYETGTDGNVNVDALKVGDPADICAPAAVEAGYTGLFDGTLASLDKWRLAGAGSFGRQADCSLRSEGGLGLLWYTASEFRDYSLKLDWKLVKDDNGGVFVGFPNPGNNPFVAVDQGYEVQIDATDAPDATTGAIYKFQGADAESVKAALKPVGMWNSYEIQVQGQTIKVLLNGTLVNTFTNTQEARDLASGFIGVQNHGGGETVSYRNIRIKGGAIDPPAPTVTVTLPGSYQKAAGCPGDWQPECTVTEATDADRDGVYTWSTDAIPVGSYEVKAAHGRSWDENYGAGGVRGGDNIPFTVPTAGSTVTFSYTLSTHVLTVTVTAPQDTTAPTTSATTDPATGAGWSKTPVTVTLTATDGSGSVRSTEYRIGNGDWTTYGQPFVLGADGEHIVQYRSTDASGNRETATSLTVRIDRTAPAVTVTTDPATAGGTGGWDVGSVLVELAATDGGSGVSSLEVSLDGKTWTAYTKGLLLRTDGVHDVHYRATDAAGNVTGSKRTVWIDSTLPVLTVTGVDGGGSYGDSGRRTISVTASDATSTIASLSVRLDDEPFTSGSVQDLWRLPLGEHVLVVTAADKAGHTVTQAVRFTTTTSVADLLAHVERARAEQALSDKHAAALVSVLDKAKVAAAKGKTADAAKAMGEFLTLVKDTKKTVTDASTRTLLVRDGEAVRTQFARG